VVDLFAKIPPSGIDAAKGAGRTIWLASTVAIAALSCAALSKERSAASRDKLSRRRGKARVRLLVLAQTTTRKKARTRNQRGSRRRSKTHKRNHSNSARLRDRVIIEREQITIELHKTNGRKGVHRRLQVHLRAYCQVIFPASALQPCHPSLRLHSPALAHHLCPRASHHWGPQVRHPVSQAAPHRANHLQSQVACRATRPTLAFPPAALFRSHACFLLTAVGIPFHVQLQTKVNSAGDVRGRTSRAA